MSNGSQLYTFLEEDMFLMVNYFPYKALLLKIMKIDCFPLWIYISVEGDNA